MGASLGARLAKPTNEVPHTSGMAIAGFVCAFFCTILGLIFSVLGYNECKNSNGIVKGQGLAVAGICISIVNLLLGIVYYAALRDHGR